MADTPTPSGGEPAHSVVPGRRYWIDDDGNVHGVVMTVEVDHVFEFTDQAVEFPQKPAAPDQPAP